MLQLILELTILILDMSYIYCNMIFKLVRRVFYSSLSNSNHKKQRMDIRQYKDERFFLVPFNEEFCWEIEEDGFVIIIGEAHYQAFIERVESKKQDNDFRFLPRGKFTELENIDAINLNRGYAQDFLETIVDKTREISFADFEVLNRTLGTKWKHEDISLFHQQTDEYNTDSPKPKYDYVSWGYGLFYSTLMDD